MTTAQKLLSARHLPIRVEVDTDILSVTNYMFGKRVVRDRFNMLNHLSNIMFDLYKKDRIPEPTDKPLSTIIDEAAQKIVLENNRICAFWSGGVDSTCLVSALVKNEANDGKDFLIICGDSSIKESPWFYEWLLSKNIKVEVRNNLQDFLDTNNYDILVNGCCADQLFGHMIHRRDPTLYNQEWITAIDKFYKQLNLPLSKNSLETFYYYWQHYANAFDLKLTQFCEFAWLYNFGIRFSLIKDQLPLQFAHTKSVGKFYAFYSGYDFQCWSVGNFNHIKDYNQIFDSRHYKMPLKQYTYQVTDNLECLDHGKHVSLMDKKNDVNIVVRETDRVLVYQNISPQHYEQIGTKIGNEYRKQPCIT